MKRKHLRLLTTWIVGKLSSAVKQQMNFILLHLISCRTLKPLRALKGGRSCAGRSTERQTIPPRSQQRTRCITGRRQTPAAQMLCSLRGNRSVLNTCCSSSRGSAANSQNERWWRLTGAFHSRTGDTLGHFRPSICYRDSKYLWWNVLCL